MVKVWLIFKHNYHEWQGNNSFELRKNTYKEIKEPTLKFKTKAILMMKYPLKNFQDVQALLHQLLSTLRLMTQLNNFIIKYKK